MSEAILSFEAGPDPNTARMLDVLEPLSGASVLDVACGSGLTTAWLAQRGARVVGVDLSPASIERARELCDHAGVTAEFAVGDFGPSTFPSMRFERLAGRYALHHLQLSTALPALSELLVAGGRGAFVETMATNPVLRFARRHVAGRWGVPRYGSLDEHPLTGDDLLAMRAAFGGLRVELGQMTFLRIFDRQVLHYRRPWVSRALAGLDDLLARHLLPASWSYHQVVVVNKR